MGAKEATGRIKINKLLEAAGWHFFEEDGKPANVCLELHCKTNRGDLETFGDDFEGTTSGFIDFLLLDEKNFPCVRARGQV